MKTNKNKTANKNKIGSVTLEIILLLIAVVFTSALILFLIQSGILSVKAQNQQVQLLNTEFIPVQRQGSLAIQDFQFCTQVTDTFNCIKPTETFVPGDEVHFKFIVQSSTYNGQIMLVENYRLRAPDGKIILDVDQRNDFNFDVSSNNPQELINFKDYFKLLPNSSPGEYTLELVLENPLLNKKATLTKILTERK